MANTYLYPFLDPAKLVLESIYEGPGGSKAHLHVINGAILGLSSALR